MGYILSGGRALGFSVMNGIGGILKKVGEGLSYQVKLPLRSEVVVGGLRVLRGSLGLRNSEALFLFPGRR